MNAFIFIFIYLVFFYINKWSRIFFFNNKNLFHQWTQKKNMKSKPKTLTLTLTLTLKTLKSQQQISILELFLKGYVTLSITGIYY